MKHIIYNIVYGAVCSLTILFVGIFVPRKYFNYENAVFREKSFERGGKLYTECHINEWKGKLPDMSKYVKGLLEKKISGNEDEEGLWMLVQETCVAETAHYILILLSVGMIIIANDAVGFLCALAYALGNVPYIMIQRYNRPRLLKMIGHRVDRQKRRLEASA